MPEKELMNQAGTWNWTDKTLWSVVGLFLLGHLYTSLVSSDPFNMKKFIGEMVGAVIGGVILYSMGLLQNMSEVQIILMGGLGGLGGVRFMEWALKIFNEFRSVGGGKK